MTKREEIRDGRVFTVTVVPDDKRLSPSATRKRALKPTLSKREQRDRAIVTKGAAGKRKLLIPENDRARGRRAG